MTGASRTDPRPPTQEDPMTTADSTAKNIEPEPEPIKHSFTIEVEVDAWWPDYVAHGNDIFRTNYIGYWAFGVAHDDTLGWLVYEHGDERRPDDEECDRVTDLWKRGEALPERWFRIDKSVAMRAWEEGVKQWGVRWTDKTDANREDAILQLALLGELRYG
jgi:hypothetical protein